MTGTSRQTSYEAWTEHRHFKYRGCAPDPDHPGRAVGSPEAGVWVCRWMRGWGMTGTGRSLRTIGRRGRLPRSRCA
jgi:hypothetical protein